LVIPVWNKKSQLIGVFDIDSDQEDAFSDYDAEHIEKILDAVFRF
jgi:GAF domain-containing protein